MEDDDDGFEDFMDDFGESIGMDNGTPFEATPEDRSGDLKLNVPASRNSWGSS